MKRERKLREISLREISLGTKISIRYLEALERNDFASLPGGAFNKGFLRAYAAFIGLDPEEMVNHYLYELARQRETPESERNEASLEDSDRRRRLLFIALGAVVSLSLLLLLWWVLPSRPA
ncbi:MAG: helix-turn-helix domain-containing protein [Acidobacteriota bacterium]